jgi:hypothetical protein
MISYLPFTGYESYKYRSNFSILKNMDFLPDIILNCAWSPIIWKDGIAKTENFISADFLVLDFDDVGDQNMTELDHSLQDHKRIVATTKSHRLLKNDLICDRYRLLIPFTTKITDYRTYRYNYRQALEKYYWADKSCVDGARFFFPSKSIITYDRESEYTWDVLPAPPDKVYERRPVDGIIPAWCLSFINDGKLQGNSRSVTLFSVAMELFRQGFAEQDVRSIINRSPIKWTGVSFEAIIKSARKKV